MIMRIATYIIIVLLLAAVIFFAVRPKENLLDDPLILKFARINAELTIEYEYLKHDSALLAPVRDSILKHFDVSEKWMTAIEERINRQPEIWVDIYELMIEHAMAIKDSLLHKKPPRNDST